MKGTHLHEEQNKISSSQITNNEEIKIVQNPTVALSMLLKERSNMEQNSFLPDHFSGKKKKISWKKINSKKTGHTFSTLQIKKNYCYTQDLNLTAHENQFILRFPGGDFLK